MFLSSNEVLIQLFIRHSHSRLYYEVGNTPSSAQPSSQLPWPRNLIWLRSAMPHPRTPQHAKGGHASLLRCSGRGTRTRVSALLTTQSGGFRLLESINNASHLCHLGSQPRGIIVLGDSAGAHFHIPPEWVTASQMSLVSRVGSDHPHALARWPVGVCPFALSTCDTNSKPV